MSDVARSRAEMPTGTQGKPVTGGVLGRRTVAGDHRSLLGVLRKGMTVLDVGCGSGAITRDIARIVDSGKVIGLDINERLLEEGNAYISENPNLSFVEGDIYGLGWQDEFDVVTAARVLQWLDHPEVATRKLIQCTKPGGTVVVLDYNHEMAAWRPELPVSMRSFYEAFLRWRADACMNNRLADDLERIMRGAGLKDVRVEVSDEVSNKGDADFEERVRIWQAVADARGPQLVRDGYVSEQLRAQASADYGDWMSNTAEYQRLYLRTAIGAKPTAS